MNRKILSGSDMPNQSSVRETMKFRDMPQRISDDVRDCLKHYAAPISGVDEEKECFLGSCTFVEIDGHYFILTAAHVWKELKAFPCVGVTVRRHTAPSVKIPTRLLKPIVVGEKSTDEWGPDLVFLKLGAPDVATIEAYKSFWNLGMRRGMESTPLLEIEDGMWVVVGAPAQQVQTSGNHRTFKMRVSVCSAEAYSVRSQFDYIDAGTDATIANALPTYGGMSGSGLWRVRLIRNQAGHLVWLPKDLSLEGVAFWESPIVNGRRNIRCHGRKSLYGEGLAAIDGTTK